MKKIPIKDLLDLVKAVNYSGAVNLYITDLIDILNDQPESEGQLFWCNDINSWRLSELNTGTVIVSQEASATLVNTKLNIIEVEKPRKAFKMILEKYFLPERKTSYISKTASIHHTVKLFKDAYVGENVVIEDDCSIGEGCSIGSNTIIHKGTSIGNNVTIGCNNTIGGVGFGYEKSDEGEWQVMPHIGNVVISDNVEIGNNTCIDRAVLGSTVIGKNVKIDNLVHVAHGVKICENALIIAHAMLGGSAVIGKNVWFGPSASILNKGIVNDDAFIGMAAVVVKPVAENTVVAGNPAKYLRDNNIKK